MRNAQLCIFTIPIAFAGTFMVEDKYLKEDGSMLHGFTWLVWMAIFTNAAGGMIVAVVMKFAGNILRNFAQVSLILTPNPNSSLHRNLILALTLTLTTQFLS